MFTRFLKTAISISNSIYKSNLSTCIVNVENVEPFIFGDAFLNFVWFETFARAPFFDFGHFQRIFTTGRDHFTNNIVNSINGAFGLSGTIFNAKGQRVFRHLHQSHGFIDIFFFNCIDGPETGKCCSQPRILRKAKLLLGLNGFEI